jgi:hypothetical protein
VSITPERLGEIAARGFIGEGEAQSMARELTRLRELEAAVREVGDALEAGASALDDIGHTSWCGVYTSTGGDCDCEFYERLSWTDVLRRLRSLVAKPTEQEQGE